MTDKPESEDDTESQGQTLYLEPERKKTSGERNVTEKAGGSQHKGFNQRVINDALRSFWNPSNDPDGGFKQSSQVSAVVGLIGFAPRNEHEGMLAAQLVASHAATMECFRRAAITDQTYEGRQGNLNLANKSARTFAILTESLMKLRGESGKQSAHVHHHRHDGRTQIAAETANVSLSGHPPAGDMAGKQEQPHEPRPIPHDQATAFDIGPPLRGKDKSGDAVPVTGDDR